MKTMSDSIKNLFDCVPSNMSKERKRHAVESMLILLPVNHSLVQEYNTYSKNWRSRYQPDKVKFDDYNTTELEK